MTVKSDLTLVLFDSRGNAYRSCDWQDAAERIVKMLNPYDSTANTVYEYARAHRILDGIWDELVAAEGGEE